MPDEYSFLRIQYEEIIEHCDYLLKYSTDEQVLVKAKESKLRAQHYLARLHRDNA